MGCWGWVSELAVDGAGRRDWPSGLEVDEAGGLPTGGPQLAVHGKFALQHLADVADLRCPHDADHRVEEADRLLVVNLRPQQDGGDAKFLHRLVQREVLGAEPAGAYSLQPARIDEVADDADKVDVVGADGEVERDLERFCWTWVDLLRSRGQRGRRWNVIWDGIILLRCHRSIKGVTRCAVLRISLRT